MKCAARSALESEGVDDELIEDATQSVGNALGNLDRSFAKLVEPEVERVSRLIPDLVRPDARTWVKQISEYRNAFAHMAPRKGKADLRLTPWNVDALCDIAVAGRWVIRIMILTELVRAADFAADSAFLAEALSRNAKLREDIEVWAQVVR